jgi:hypothetical protein
MRSGAAPHNVKPRGPLIRFLTFIADHGRKLQPQVEMFVAVPVVLARLET